MELIKDAKDMWRGVALCLVIAVPSWLLGKSFEVVGGPVFAILLGMVLAQVLRGRAEVAAAAAPGVKFTSKKVLQYAVILLGFGLNLNQIAQVGATSLPVIVATISTSLIISFVLCRALKIPGKISTLVGVGSSICGGSAIAATAPVIDADDEEIAQAISVIFLFNIIAALVFPALGGALGLTNDGFGLFAGTAVNDTSSVTAAASAWDGMHPGANALDHATIVKLTRTLAIIPITLGLALWRSFRARRAAAAMEPATGAAASGCAAAGTAMGAAAGSAMDTVAAGSTAADSAMDTETGSAAGTGDGSAAGTGDGSAAGTAGGAAGTSAASATGSFSLKKVFPTFILFFVLASVVTTVFALPAAVTAPIKELSKFFIVMAMAAIGFNADIVKLVRTGGKPILMGFCCWAGIAAVSLGMQHLLGIW